MTVLCHNVEWCALTNGTRIFRRAPIVSHLLFSNDSFFFFRADGRVCQQIKDILGTYGHASSQAINFYKSDIFFSSNCPNNNRENISLLLGVHNSLDYGRYLGLPSLVGRNKRRAFSFLKDRLWKGVCSWNGKFLSRAGKKILPKPFLLMLWVCLPFLCVCVMS